jgi:hypothetical protein
MEIKQEERVALNVPGIVKISDFRYTFENIILTSGYHLKTVYGHTLYRMLLSRLLI